MKKLFIIIIALCAFVFVTQANNVAQTAPEPTDNVNPFVVINITDLPEEVRQRIQRTLYLQGYRAQTQTVYQHRETKEIKVNAISNEASHVTFFFDQYGNYIRS
ncbi:MAG: hypothetical protein FWC98_00040 [Bacteroidales bacterium]|nr:hypothetical protein [Bacteroidales bacterium]